VRSAAAARLRAEPRAGAEPTRRAVLAYLAALNARDPDAVAACVSDDFVNEHASSLGRGVAGRGAYRERLFAFFAEFADIHYEPEEVIADGHAAAVPYRMTATWLGDPDVRHPINLRGVFRFRTAAGMITQRTDYWDSADFLRQVGRTTLEPVRSSEDEEASDDG
jgi:steroid delta-isomerase-like uncharacterized protein